MTTREHLMQAHRALALGSPEDMQAARLVLRLLRYGHITLFLSDVEWKVERLLEDIGVPLYYRHYRRATYAKI